MRGLRFTTAFCAALAALIVWSLPAAAQDNEFRIGYIDPLSGSFAIAGETGAKHFDFFADMINAEGGLLGQKVVIMKYDSQLNSKVAVEKVRQAIGDGADLISQGNSSGIAHAITDAVLRYNTRNPGKEVLYFNYAAVDPALTNEDCNFWHFRFDANADIKMKALVHGLVQAGGMKKVYLLNQNYSFGKAVAAAAERELAQQAPDVKIVGNELHPIAKVKDFTPYVNKIQASGADTVITGNWGPDMSLLAKAASEVGLKARIAGYYADFLGVPRAMGKSGIGTLNISEYNLNEATLVEQSMNRQFKEKANEDFYYYRVRIMFDMLQEAAKRAGTTKPIPLARALEGMQRYYGTGRVFMRKDDHQIFMPLTVNIFSDKVKYDVEGTGIGWGTFQAVDVDDTLLPTTCKMKRP